MRRHFQHFQAGRDFELEAPGGRDLAMYRKSAAEHRGSGGKLSGAVEVALDEILGRTHGGDRALLIEPTVSVLDRP